MNEHGRGENLRGVRLWDMFRDVAIWSSDYPHHDAEDAWEALHHMGQYGVPAEARATCSATMPAVSTALSRC